MSDLRGELIKLAAEKPDLREHLVPILRESASAKKIWRVEYEDGDVLKDGLASESAAKKWIADQVAKGNWAGWKPHKWVKTVNKDKEGNSWTELSGGPGNSFLITDKVKKGKTASGSGAANAKYLRGLSAQDKDKILKAVADHYGISVREAEVEVTDADAEALYEYIGNDRGLAVQVHRDFQRMKSRMAHQQIGPQTIKRIQDLTKRNQHTEALIVAAEVLGMKNLESQLHLIAALAGTFGHMPSELVDLRYRISKPLYEQARQIPVSGIKGAETLKDLL